MSCFLIVVLILGWFNPYHTFPQSLRSLCGRASWMEIQIAQNASVGDSINYINHHYLNNSDEYSSCRRARISRTLLSRRRYEKFVSIHGVSPALLWAAQGTHGIVPAWKYQSLQITWTVEEEFGCWVCLVQGKASKCKSKLADISKATMRSCPSLLRIRGG